MTAVKLELDRAAGQREAGSENCLPIGTHLSDFEITGVLGEGGFGIVYVAYDHALQRTVAIKEYMPGVLAMRAAGGGVALRAERHQETFGLGLKSFINEARFLAQFDHPALIKVYRFWEQNNTAYTAMKFYDGRTIKDIVSNSPELVDEAWCRKVLRQILQALETLYTMQILHRDISPDNIIVQENGDAVLLDFGSARQIIGDMTRGLTVILKPGYAPVEQYAGDASLEQGPFTDLYALSAVMYFAITKAPPPPSIGRMIHDPIVALRTLAPVGFSASFLAAIDGGLAVLAQDRPQTIDAFRKQLGLMAPEQAALPPSVPYERRAAPSAPAAPVADAAAGAPVSGVPAPDLTPAPDPVPPSAPQPAARPAVLAASLPAASSPAAPGGPRPNPSRPNRGRLLIGAGGAGVLAAAVAGSILVLGSSSQDPVPPAQQVHAGAAPVPPAAAVGAAGAAPGSTGQDNALPHGATVITDDAAEVADTAAAPPGAAAGNDALVLLPSKAEPKRAAAPVAPTAASYKLRIKPWGTLYVDGKPRGVSPPLKQITLAPGKHTIRVVNPGFPEFLATVDVDKGRTGAIEHDFSAP